MYVLNAVYVLQFSMEETRKDGIGYLRTKGRLGFVAVQKVYMYVKLFELTPVLVSPPHESKSKCSKYEVKH